MATVQAFEVPGLKMWFWSYVHEPPHLHAKREGEWEVKVHFLRASREMIELVWADKKPQSRLLKELAQLAAEHRLELLEEWEKTHRN